MCCRYVVDQLHDQDGLTYSRTAEQTDFTTLCIGANQVYDLDTGLQNLGRRYLLLVSRSLTVDGPVLLRLRSRLIVYRVAQKVEYTAKALLAYRNLDGLSGIQGLCSSDETVSGVHGDTADRIVADLLCHLNGQLRTVVIDFNGVQQRRQLVVSKPDVQYGAGDLHYLTNVFFTHS